jgi:tRNA A37 threonylcarbamoyladenosine synthetase subunit TsaC/SUA5/YrdC
MLLLLPTDTCYGLAWDFTRENFLTINTLKWRDDTKRLALLVEDFEDLKPYVMISDEQIEFLKKYPHPWSFLGVRNPDFILPDWMEENKYEMFSLRVAKVCILNYEWSITNYEYPLFLTSANLSGHPESKTLEEAQRVFPWIEGIDGGICDQPPSDIFSIDERGELKYLRRNYN